VNDESRLGDEWDALGRRNAMGVILTREGRAGEWEFEEFLATGRAEVARFIAELSKVAPALPRRRALDFGCGIGRVTLALSEHFEHVTGVDVAASMIERARQTNRDRPNCTFVLNRAPDLSQFPSGSFETVYTRLVLQHIRPDLMRTYLAELIRVVAPGGILMAQLPTPAGSSASVFVNAPVTGSALKRSLSDWIVRSWRRLKFRVTVRRSEAWREIHGLTREEVTALITRAGGRVVAAHPDQSHGTDGAGFEYWATRPVG